MGHCATFYRTAAPRFYADLRRFFNGPLNRESSEASYDEFCLVANFIVDPLQSVELLPIRDVDIDVAVLPAKVLDRLQQRKRKRKPAPVPSQVLE